MSLPSFLTDRRFLQQIDHLRVKEQFVRITVLDWKQRPLQTIQGIVINGSVNLDGSSSVRRTATLTLFAEEQENDLSNINNLFAINKKCKLQIGIKNTVPPYTYYTQDGAVTINYIKEYGQIVWFPLGIYVMFNPSISHSLTGVNISMQLKDKMCLLNGDLAGQIHSSVEFSPKDYIDENAISHKQPVLIFQLIQQLVNHWGNQQLSKIIISEVPDKIKMAVKWTGESPLYYNLEDVDPSMYPDAQTYKVSTLPISDQYWESGRDVGFVFTDYVYPGQLVCNAGDTVTSVLDKIIGIMGNYEYFYDVEGNFVFQQKKNYLNMTNTAVWEKDGDKVLGLPSDVWDADFYRLTKPVYNFSGSDLIVSFNDTFNYNNVKNDFVVWGYRKSGNGYQLPVRFHLAIGKKPMSQYHAVVYYKDNFGITRARAATQQQYTKDTQGIPVAPAAAFQTPIENAVQIDSTSTIVLSKDWREQIYYQMCESEIMGTDQNIDLNNQYFSFYAELKEQFPKIYNLRQGHFSNDYINNPQDFNYFFDMIDQDSELGQYSIGNIGKRSLIIDGNNEGINCVFEPVIPDIAYIASKKMSSEEYQKQMQRMVNLKQAFIQVNNQLYSLFEIGGSYNSCFEKIKDLLYQYSHMNNNISITFLPIYYLQPNTRITVEDSTSGIYGDYIIQSISLPLDISSTMSINAYKALYKI